MEIKGSMTSTKSHVQASESLRERCGEFDEGTLHEFGVDLVHLVVTWGLPPQTLPSRVRLLMMGFLERRDAQGQGASSKKLWEFLQGATIASIFCR